MAEANPTNERLAELLDEVERELREPREQQQKLADEIRKLAGTPSN